jgi:hypothetical protein
VKRARFIAAARLEFLAEVIFHNEAQPGLGARFTAAVEEATARALAFPHAGSPFTTTFKRRTRATTRRGVEADFVSAFCTGSKSEPVQNAEIV